jgi:putative FmdB family regulatory protein
MPTYQYACAKCGHEFELFQSIADAPLTVCPPEACLRKKWGKGPVKRLISAGAGLLFKGSGFYITDYRSEKYREAAKKEAPATGGAGGNGKSSGGAAGGGESKASPAPKEAKAAQPAKAGS